MLLKHSMQELTIFFAQIRKDKFQIHVKSLNTVTEEFQDVERLQTRVENSLGSRVTKVSYVVTLNPRREII
jgi:hypothetical protein